VIPAWERRWPGRLQDELDALEAAGVVPEIDQVALAEGVLVLRLEWSVDGKRIALRAVFPDVYPRMRPEVFAIDLPTMRHMNPSGRNLCLLGRGSHRWSSSFTLARLLQEQLPALLAGAGEEPPAAEDRQGEPAEEWWNALAAKDSYCLIDSAWELDPAVGHGRARLRYVAAAGPRPRFRAYVERVTAPDGRELARWTAPVPLELQDAAVMTVPWARASRAPLPEPPLELAPLTAFHPSFARHGIQPLVGPGTGRAAVHCIVYPAETGWRSYGDGWLFLMTFARPNPRQGALVQIIRTLRAGREDRGARAPAAAALAGKTIAVFGLGAIGAPLAVELARNGCGELRLVEPDDVEPGNAVRWPLGARAWGSPRPRRSRASSRRNTRARASSRCRA
jgi:hypothetical protein